MSDLDRLNAFLDKALPSGGLGAVREISPGDENSLAPSEGHDLERAVLSVRRARGTGRVLARHLCMRIGSPVSEIPRSSLRYPVWPCGIVGSISHDREFAAAAVGPASRFTGIGVDIEPAEAVSADVAAHVTSSTERAAFSDIEFAAKAIFSIKEAVFKAVYPNDGIFLEFQNVFIDRKRSVARTACGGSVHWRLLTEPRVLAVAWY